MKTIVDIVSRKDGAEILRCMVDLAKGLQRLNGMITVTIYCVSSGEVADYARGSTIAESVTKVIGAIVAQVTESVDTAIDVVSIQSTRSILSSTAGEARGSNVVVRREAGFNVVDPLTETPITVVSIC